MECENTYNPLFSRVRVRAYIQEFSCFCCHKCHRRFIINSKPYDYADFVHLLTVWRYILSKSQCRILEKRVFLLGFHPSFSRHGITRASSVLLIWLNENVPFCSTPHLIFPSFSSELPPPCDTCDSKKTQLRLERARLRVCARNSTAFCSASSLFNFNLNALHLLMVHPKEVLQKQILQHLLVVVCVCYSSKLFRSLIIDLPIAAARLTGTAFPICLY